MRSGVFLHRSCRQQVYIHPGRADKFLQRESITIDIGDFVIAAVGQPLEGDTAKGMSSTGRGGVQVNIVAGGEIGQHNRIQINHDDRIHLPICQAANGNSRSRIGQFIAGGESVPRQSNLLGSAIHIGQINFKAGGLIDGFIAIHKAMPREGNGVQICIHKHSQITIGNLETSRG